MAQNHVQLNLSLVSSGAKRQGFGMPLILTHKALFPDRTATFSEASELLELDGIDELSPEYLAAVVLTSQELRPRQFALGRADDVAVTLQYTLDIQAVQNSTRYGLTVVGDSFEIPDGDEVEYTSDASATAGEIMNGLLTALNAVADKNYTAAFAALTFADATFTAEADDDTLTFGGAHNLSTGDGPFQLSNSGGALPTGSAALTDYYVVVTGATTLKLATSRANALAGTVVNLTTDGTGTQTMSDTGATATATSITVTADAPGDWFAIALDNRKQLYSRMSHSVTGLGTALSEMLDESDEWYCLLLLFPSNDYVKDALAWCEANGRICAWDTPENRSIRLAYSQGVSTDTLAQVLELGYKGSLGSYYPNPARFFSAGWMGGWLPYEPGKATAKFKEVVGVETTVFTTTERNNLTARRGNGYETVYQKPITFEGTVASTKYKFIDITRNLDWLTDEVLKQGFGILAGAPIIPYTRAGIERLAGGVRAALSKSIRQGVGSPDHPVTVIPPDLAEIEAESPEDIENAVLRNMKFTHVLASKVHNLIIDGTLTFATSEA